MRHRLTATLLALIFCAAPAVAQVRLVEAGIVCPRVTTGELLPAPGTETGTIRRIDQETVFDLPDRRVPMMTDLSFGFRTELQEGEEAREVQIVVTHPPMGPRGVVRQEWADTIYPGDTNLNLFTFEFPYEKVPGRWTFAVELDGAAIVSVPFEVGVETARGPVEAACFRFMS